MIKSKMVSFNILFSKIELCDDLAVNIFEEVERNGVTIRKVFMNTKSFLCNDAPRLHFIL